jgi:Putative Actinobacterial Holin-X, holin superfamily III
MPSPRSSTGEATPTRGSETTSNGGLGGAAKQVAEHASSIARLEIELAILELKKKLASFGIGIALGLGAAIVGVFMLGFLFATIAAALATFLAWWLALLIVTAALGMLAGLLGFLALGMLKKGSPPVPEQAIREAKLTTEAIKAP